MAWGLVICMGIASHSANAESYPKTAQICTQVGTYSDAQRDSLSWYDLVAFTEGPNVVDDLRGRNPEIDLLFAWMPQLIYDHEEDETFWYPDTSWSLVRLAEFYALQNDWYLYNTDGSRPRLYNSWISNWTPDCPPGTYGDSNGLTYAEWLVQKAIPRIIHGEARWEEWGPNSSAYQGFFFEVMGDCMNVFPDADPDRDGIPEGIYSSCCSGGSEDPLAVMMREVNGAFGNGLRETLGPDIAVIINGVNNCVRPDWNWINGIKLESWNQSPNPSWLDWWSFFYSLTNYSGDVSWETGYTWAEENLGRSGNDSAEGWDMTMLQVVMKDTWTDSFTQKRRAYGMGTAMLGDGYYTQTVDQQRIHYTSELDWDFGDAVEDYFVEIYEGVTPYDSLYVRRFEKGMVEV
ncbi:MAG: hypothetical protein KDA27_25550, partial [Candidatus Eisenbacteria bacterium]|nr:hypothetical protein [Candidatus Eisenbacteria bacterium]